MSIRPASLLGAMAAALAFAPAGVPLDEGRYTPRAQNKRAKRKARSKPPQPSKPLPEEYRDNVRAQRGFTTRRLEIMRAEWIGACKAAKKVSAPQPEWATWLNNHRKSVLEKQFAGE